MAEERQRRMSLPDFSFPNYNLRRMSLPNLSCPNYNLRENAAAAVQKKPNGTSNINDSNSALDMGASISSITSFHSSTEELNKKNKDLEKAVFLFNIATAATAAKRPGLDGGKWRTQNNPP